MLFFSLFSLSSALLGIMLAGSAYADCPHGTVDMSDNADSDECASTRYPKSGDLCPPGMVRAAGDKNGACIRLQDGTLVTMFDPVKGCPDGYQLVIDAAEKRACEKNKPPAEALPTSTEPACGYGAVPVINRLGILHCLKDSRVAVNAAFKPEDGCPVGARLGADAKGRHVCRSR